MFALSGFGAVISTSASGDGAEVAKSKKRSGFKPGQFKGKGKRQQGPAKLVYKHKTKGLSGGGLSPCTNEIAYTYQGKMTPRKITASVNITLNGEFLAESRLSMKK